MGTVSSRKARFVAEYCRNPNTRQAAIRAGYSLRQAGHAAAKLLKQADVVAALDAHRRQHFKTVEDKGERVLAEFMRVAFCDLRRLLDAKGRLKPLREIDDEVIAGVQFFDPKPRPRGKVLRLRRQGKLAALKMLGKYLGVLDMPQPRDAAAGEAASGEVDLGEAA